MKREIALCFWVILNYIFRVDKLEEMRGTPSSGTCGGEKDPIY